MNAGDSAPKKRKAAAGWSVGRSISLLNWSSFDRLATVMCVRGRSPCPLTRRSRHAARHRHRPNQRSCGADIQGTRTNLLAIFLIHLPIYLSTYLPFHSPMNLRALIHAHTDIHAGHFVVRKVCTGSADYTWCCLWAASTMTKPRTNSRYAYTCLCWVIKIEANIHACFELPKRIIIFVEWVRHRRGYPRHDRRLRSAE